MSPDAAHAAALFALDPHGIGLWLRARPGPARDAWLALLRRLLPAAAPVRRCPPGIADERLLGGLDLPATFAAGCRIVQPGLLAEADGGVLLLGMAERLAGATASRIAAALDTGEVALERDGLARRLPSRFGVVALDEGGDDETPPPALLERLAIRLDLDDASGASCAAPTARAVAAARTRLPQVRIDGPALEALCAASLALGIASGRATLLAVCVARAAAALAGRRVARGTDAALAARLVLAPRATRLPAPPDAGQEASAAEPPDGGGDSQDDDAGGHAPSDHDQAGGAAERETVLHAIRAALPGGVLPQPRQAGPTRQLGAGTAGRGGAPALRGRPAGVRRGAPEHGARLSLIETLRAAAPWQRLRRNGGGPARIALRRDDFRVRRFVQRPRTTCIFAVDASGSSALHRLAEAKGAVEMLLAECYVRRDRVALLAFRNRAAELLLPPTSAPARARRCLAELPGGGGTPLAAGLDAAAALADAVRARGEAVVVILLTDGRANVTRNGAGGRAEAEAEALDGARRLRAAGHPALLVDISPRPNPSAARLAAAMGAAFLPLPQADAAALSRAARAALPSLGARSAPPDAP